MKIKRCCTFSDKKSGVRLNSSVAVFAEISQINGTGFPVPLIFAGQTDKLSSRSKNCSKRMLLFFFPPFIGKSCLCITFLGASSQLENKCSQVLFVHDFLSSEEFVSCIPMICCALLTTFVSRSFLLLLCIFNVKLGIFGALIKFQCLLALSALA